MATEELKSIPSTTARTRAPAKLNLFLELLRRREDGYHEIDTVMVPINWYDDLTLKRTENPSIGAEIFAPNALPLAFRQLSQWQ